MLLSSAIAPGLELLDEFQAFFSYAHADAVLDPKLFEAFSNELAARVSGKLANAKLSVWRDIHKIETGDQWNATIEQALKASQLLIVMLSPNWLKSDYCRNEFDVFMSVEPAPKTFVIPLLVHGVAEERPYLNAAQQAALDALLTRQFKPVLAEDFLQKSQQQMSALVAEVATHVKGKIDVLRKQGGEPKGRSGAAAATTPDRYDISRIDSYAPEKLIGRETETKIIDEGWAAAVRGDAKRPRILTFVAMGGEGKTSLVADWAVRQQVNGWPDCEAAFAWSFYSQGTRDQYAGDSDLFLANALDFFGAPAKEGEGAVEKAKRLARLIGEKRALLILDGLEPLQYPPTWSPPGELKDDAMAALLKALAANSKGLCLVTTRYSIPNLKAYRDASAPEVDLKRLPKQAGAHLLKMLGVVGTQNEREALSEDAKGHALTLTLIGGYLRDAHGGDIRKRDLFNLAEADEEEQGGHAFRAMAAYVRWFEQDKGGRRALGMLRLMGLFDWPADLGCLRALWRGPEIKGVTDSIVGLGEAHRNIAIKRLEDANLLTVSRDAGGALVSLDAHPLLREYFAKELRKKNPEGWKAAHKRLYEHLCATTKEGDAPTLDDLRPLYQAVAHGCRAGLQQKACDEIFLRRIQRLFENYSINKLGAFGINLGTIACFFYEPWRKLSPGLSASQRAILQNAAAYCLRGLGRLQEALEPMQAALQGFVALEVWDAAAGVASNLSELELTLGDITAAVREGASSVEYASRGITPQAIISLTTYADALHQQGELQGTALFSRAESIQKQWLPDKPVLYSLAGFRYCDMLLAYTERAAWRCLLSVGAKNNAIDAAEGPESLFHGCEEAMKRAQQTLRWGEEVNRSRLDTALDHFTLANATLYAAIVRGAAPDSLHIEAAASGLRDAGTKHEQPRGFLTRALYRAVTGDFLGARDDLVDAFDIAERGPMKLFLADIHLHRARLFGLYAKRPEKYPWESPERDLAEARRLIEECGYWRRKEELEDAEAALRELERLHR